VVKFKHRISKQKIGQKAETLHSSDPILSQRWFYEHIIKHFLVHVSGSAQFTFHVIRVGKRFTVTF
jgi:hypothetical protein